ncbi:hypothetical protein GW17_00050683 [Ensete ventricosum]|uniref:Uncharacterized protein n=1 Tax=Ensete ventricosum TaxID=4639 RepID=A0A444CN91_ENSVE|nr:hypothetical protein GW17_00050683 [Ensete ventricosum]RZR71391.1 hypothetical protein BHM03_00004896 [Ensete ventricosum]
MAKRAVRYAVIDAFTGSPFKGNPAAVCLLDSSSPEEEVSDEWMQSVATEFNISETCFLSRAISDVGAGSDGPSSGACLPRFSLRWFTPVAEVTLCPRSFVLYHAFSTRLMLRLSSGDGTLWDPIRGPPFHPIRNVSTTWSDPSTQDCQRYLRAGESELVGDPIARSPDQFLKA